MATKKSKSIKDAKGKDKWDPIPNLKWNEKSTVELKDLVTQMELDRDSYCKKRNSVQVELGSIQSYNEITQERTRRLDMETEKIDLEIENCIEDNSVELQVYEQKKFFLNYCHNNKLSEKESSRNSQIVLAKEEHRKHLQNLEHANAVRRLNQREVNQNNTLEIHKLKHQYQTWYCNIKGSLDVDLTSFEESCELQHSDLKKALHTKRIEELELILIRQNSCIIDLVQSHKNHIEKSMVRFERIDKEQQIHLQDLQAEIRRLKRNSVQNLHNSEVLTKENADGNKELEICLKKISHLDSKMKDKEKDGTTLRNTKFRISSTQNSIQDAKQRFKCLKENYDDVKAERNRLRDSISDAALEASKKFIRKKETLNEKLSEQYERNIIVERHLQHILHSSGLEENRSNVLTANINEYLHENNKETEKLQLAIANAKKLYDSDLILFMKNMSKHGIPENKIESITSVQS
mmetsp:Transcript_6305/g.13732  ORF Transcript_6305/g.13732 Transcript_6305/m.13732 type:complete len:464 (+) Transcript_6305:71-1462(+)